MWFSVFLVVAGAGGECTRRLRDACCLDAASLADFTCLRFTCKPDAVGLAVHTWFMNFLFI